MTTVGDDCMVDAIRLSPLDNVATLLRPAVAGETLRVRCQNVVQSIVAREPIELCHKISLEALPAGAPVLKYGNPIGEAGTAISIGRHVHVHNMRSLRAKPVRAS